MRKLMKRLLLAAISVTAAFAMNTLTFAADTVQTDGTTDTPMYITQTGATETTATFEWIGSTSTSYYNIYITIDGVESFVGKTTTPNYTVTNLDNSKKFDLSVESITEVTSGTTVTTTSTGKSTLLSTMTSLVPAKIKSIKVHDTKNYVYKVDVADNSAYTYEYEYQVCKYNKNKVVTKWTGSASTALPTNKINAKSFYKVRVRPYSFVNGKKAYGEWSDYTYFGLNVIKSLQRTYDTTDIKVSWTKMAGAKNYTVYMSEKKNSGFKKVATTKKTSYVVKKFKKKKLKNKTYYFYVVANGKSGKKKLKSIVPYNKLGSSKM